MRTLYQKYLQWAPANCGAWCKYAEVEHSLGELARVRAIYELAIEQPLLDMPEVLWKVRLSVTSTTVPSCSAFSTHPQGRCTFTHCPFLLCFQQPYSG